MSDEQQQGHTGHQSDNNYERQDANPWMLGGALAVGMVLLGIALVLINDYFIIEKEKMINEVSMKPESSVLRDVQAHADEILTSYAVVDTAAGLYRIPLERAMKLQAEDAYKGK